jgi:serine/threonine-protein kinase RsbW
MKFEIKKKAVLENLDKTLEILMTRIKKYFKNDYDINSINLVLEEILVNIINYGFPECDPGYFKVTLDFVPSNNYLFTKVTDNGIPFNMLEEEDPNIDTPLEDRVHGGWGIFFVKKLASEVSYKRKNDNNIIELKFTSSNNTAGETI